MNECVSAPGPCKIVEQGGVLTVVDRGCVVGAFALFNHAECAFALARMAVHPAHEGKGIGRERAEKTVDDARDRGAVRSILLTNTILAPAVEL